MITDIEKQKKIDLITGLLSIFDENVISEEEYVLIKDKNVNNEHDIEFILDSVLKEWFLESSPSRRIIIIKSIEFMLENKNLEIKNIFSKLHFVFNPEIEDEVLFLTKINSFIKNHV